MRSSHRKWVVALVAAIGAVVLPYSRHRPLAVAQIADHADGLRDYAT